MICSPEKNFATEGDRYILARRHEDSVHLLDMISDTTLTTISNALGSGAMALIVAYHVRTCSCPNN